MFLGGVSLQLDYFLTHSSFHLLSTLQCLVTSLCKQGSRKSLRQIKRKTLVNLD